MVICCIGNLLFCEKFKIKLQYVIKVVGLFVQVEKKIILQNTAAAVSSWMSLLLFFFCHIVWVKFIILCVFLFPGLNLTLILVGLKIFGWSYTKSNIYSLTQKIINIGKFVLVCTNLVCYVVAFCIESIWWQRKTKRILQVLHDVVFYYPSE